MKKFTTLKTLLVGLLACAATSVWAADPDLTNDYTLVKSVTWGDGTNIAGSGACAHTAYDTGNKKQQALTILTAPTDAAGWIAMQAWTDGSGKGWWNRKDESRNIAEVYCVNAGRSAAVFGDDLTTGWLVVFECTQDASKVITLTNGGGNPDGTFIYTLSEDGKTYFCTITASENAYVGFCGNKDVRGIKKISVYKPNNAVVETTYTVKYVDMGGNTLKDNEIYNAVGGASVSITDADKANITVDETTYVYDSDNSEGVSVANDGTTVVTVKFHAAANFSYKVNEVCGEKTVRTTEKSSYETATVKVPYRKYNVLDGDLYKKDVTNKEYNYYFKLTANNQEEKLAYTKTEVTGVVFLSEGEDIEGLTPITTGNTLIRSSNSSSAYAPNNTKITTLPVGKYKIHAGIYDSATKPDSHWIFLVGNNQVADFNCTAVNLQEFDSEEFTVTCESDFIMAKAGGSTRGLDFIYIQKTGDVELPASVTVPVTSAGYATYCSEYALDLSEADAGFYTATIEGTQVSFVSQNGIVAPNTGLLIKATSDVTIPVAAEGAETIANNALIGVVASETIDAGSFVLMDSPAVGFYRTTKDFTLKANSAYIKALPVLVVESRDFIAINGEATAIKTVETKQQNGEIYNLAGQRVNKAQKGLFIQNGKKVIIK